MITIYPFEALGHHDYGWLNARYHFSFSSYRDPRRMGFGPLRVINDDIVQPGHGFAPHSHDNMEIITYVRRGAITHKDSAGNEGRTEAGDVQVMSAGSGIEHSEFNHEKSETALFQIWIEPREKNIAPRWDMRQFPREPVANALPVLVSGLPEHGKDNALWINADAAIYGGRMEKGAQITQPVTGRAYLLVSEGRVEIGGQPMKKGDGAEITDTAQISLNALDESEVVLINLAA